MAAYRNNVELIGNVGADAEMRFTAGQEPVANIRLRQRKLSVKVLRQRTIPSGIALFVLGRWRNGPGNTSRKASRCSPRASCAPVNGRTRKGRISTPLKLWHTIFNCLGRNQVNTNFWR